MGRYRRSHHDEAQETTSEESFFRKFRNSILPVKPEDSQRRRLAKRVGFVLFCIFVTLMTLVFIAGVIIAA